MKYLSWIGTIASILGSFIVASQIFILGYCCFLIGSVSWTLVGVNRKDTALVTLNGVFMLANMWGLYVAI